MVEEACWQTTTAIGGILNNDILKFTPTASCATVLAAVWIALLYYIGAAVGLAPVVKMCRFVAELTWYPSSLRTVSSAAYLLSNLISKARASSLATGRKSVNRKETLLGLIYRK